MAMEKVHALSVAAPHSASFERCEDEPIGIPGAIQPHGALVAIHLADACVSHVSYNTQAMLGLAPCDLLELAPDGVAATFGLDARAIVGGESSQKSTTAFLSRVKTPHGRSFTVQRQKSASHLFLEFEPAVQDDFSLVALVAEVASQLRRAENREALYRIAVRAIRGLTAFDRVVMYTFDASWHGEVVAEQVRPGCAKYLGLHFPNTDIPAQARAMYAETPCRAVVDVDYTPVPLVCFDAEQPPLDLRFCSLRSISPIHREYMRNFDARSSLSFSVMLSDCLFGLISCTHESGPKWISPERRSACVTIAEMLSGMLDRNWASLTEEPETMLAPSLVRKLSGVVDMSHVLLGDPPNMLGVTNADGAAIYYHEQLSSCGQVPPYESIKRLIAWLTEQDLRTGVYVTDSMPSVFSEAVAYRSSGCGLLAVASPEQPIAFMLWFRGEIRKHVSWGGKPPNAAAAAQPPPLRPRSSFSRWQEAVHLHAQPFTEREIANAKRLAREVEQGIVRQSLKLARANIDLERSNQELDAFAHAASHDLKEPLRGVHNFVALAQRELTKGQGASTIASHLHTVSKLVDRMNALIGALMHYAEVGGSRLDLRPTSLHRLIEPLLETLSNQPKDRRIIFDVADTLPTVLADPTLLSEFFTNLFTNAVKYNEHAEVEIYIGVTAAQGPGMVTLCVRDNGIGIPVVHQKDIFALFRRLHARDKFGGGNGTGLTIAKRIIEAHGLESLPGEGTTFFFSMRCVEHTT